MARIYPGFFCALNRRGYYARIAENEQFQEGGPGRMPNIKMDQNAPGIGWEVKL